MKLNIRSLNYSTILTILLVAVLTIWSELSKPFKTFLANITGHHWVTKSMFAIIFFIVMYLILSRINKEDLTVTNVKRNINYTILILILSSLSIFVFYLMHF